MVREINGGRKCRLPVLGNTGESFPDGLNDLRAEVIDKTFVFLAEVDWGQFRPLAFLQFAHGEMDGAERPSAETFPDRAAGDGGTFLLEQAHDLPNLLARNWAQAVRIFLRRTGFRVFRLGHLPLISRHTPLSCLYAFFVYRDTR